jgi:hypothetical protein
VAPWALEASADLKSAITPGFAVARAPFVPIRMAAGNRTRNIHMV